MTIFINSEKSPQKGAECFMEGDSLLTSGQYSKAIDKYNCAIKFLPDDAEILENVYWSRGLANRSLGKTKNAISDFTIAISLNSGYLSAYSMRASCYLDIGEWELAISDLKMALNSNYDLWHELATEQLIELGAIRENQASYEIYYRLGYAYNQLSDFKNAVLFLKAAYKIKPSLELKHYISQLNERINYLNL